MDEDRLKRHDLTDAEWARLEPLLPGHPRQGHRWNDHRLVIDGIFHRTRTGDPWRDLPERFGAWKKVHTRFCRWAEGGVWARVFEHLAGDADDEYAMIDSTVVRAHQHSAGAKGGIVRPRRSGAARAA